MKRLATAQALLLLLAFALEIFSPCHSLEYCEPEHSRCSCHLEFNGNDHPDSASVHDSTHVECSGLCHVPATFMEGRVVPALCRLAAPSLLPSDGGALGYSSTLYRPPRTV